MTSLLRVLRTSSVTLTHEFRSDEVLTDADGAVNVTVRRLDSTIVAGPTVAGHPSVGVYTYPLPAPSQLDMLTVDFIGFVAGSSVEIRYHVEVVGDFLFGLAAARNDLRIPSTVSTVDLASARVEVETVAEDVSSREGPRIAFVPRFARVILNGSGTSGLALPHALIRSVRSITVNGTVWSVGQLATITPSESGVLWLSGGTWPVGRQNIVVEYEHGMSYSPPSVTGAALQHLRAVLARPRSGVPDRTQSYTTGDGATYRLTMPTASTTGLPEVDAVYQRFCQELGSPV